MCDADAQIVSVWMREPTGCLPCSLESVCLFRHVWLANENRCVRAKPAHCLRVPAHAFASRKGRISAVSCPCALDTEEVCVQEPSDRVGV